MFNALRRQGREHSREKVESALRKMMSWIESKDAPE
jgi:ketol-acid reductoisomerase